MKFVETKRRKPKLIQEGYTFHRGRVNQMFNSIARPHFSVMDDLHVDCMFILWDKVGSTFSPGSQVIL